MSNELIAELIRRLAAHERRVERLEAVEIPPNLVTLSAGADIRVSGYTIARKGTGILLFDGSGGVLTEYSADATGIAAAIAAASAGDVIQIPARTITADVSVPAGVALRGRSRNASIIAGQVTLGVGSVIENMTIQNIGDSAGALYGVVSAASGTAILKDVKVRCENSTGAAYALYMAGGGNISCYEVELLAEVGSTGYAAYVTLGNLNHISGRAVGTVATYPYYI
jgi:hypothetical protein